MATSHYIVVHDRTVKAAYYGFSEVGGASDEEWHGEQEEGGGGVELHGEVFCGEGGGGETSQVAKHLIDCQVHQVQLKKNKELHHLEDHVQPTVFFKLYLLKYGTNSHLQNIPIAACFILVKRWNWPAILRLQIMALQIENSIAIFSNKNKKQSHCKTRKGLESALLLHLYRSPWRKHKSDSLWFFHLSRKSIEDKQEKRGLVKTKHLHTCCI